MGILFKSVLNLCVDYRLFNSFVELLASIGIEMTARVVAVVVADGSLVKSTVKNNITFFETF
jgi:hypothetical protein